MLGGRSHPDGVISEVMADQIEKVMRDRPLFILKNWPHIRSYKRNILAGRYLWGPGEGALILDIYSRIAAKEPKYKSGCEEIIRILSKKS
jgi:hypothetical protein